MANGKKQICPVLVVEDCCSNVTIVIQGIQTLLLSSISLHSPFNIQYFLMNFNTHFYVSTWPGRT